MLILGGNSRVGWSCKVFCAQKPSRIHGPGGANNRHGSWLLGDSPEQLLKFEVPRLTIYKNLRGRLLGLTFGLGVRMQKEESNPCAIESCPRLALPEVATPTVAVKKARPGWRVRGT